MNVRRITSADARKVARFLRDEFAADETTGGNPALFTKEEIKRRLRARVYWVAIEGGKVLGVLEGAPKVTMLHEGKYYKGWLFSLFQIRRAEGLRALEIADTIVVQHAKDLIERGAEGEYVITVSSQRASPGARYCRDFLHMKEINIRGSRSMFLLPFNKITDGPNSRGIYG